MEDTEMMNSQELILLVQGIALLLAGQHVVASESSERIDTEYYSVSGNSVDADTFRGYSAYHQACVSCHGVGGEGSPGMPSLLRTVEGMSMATFEVKVLHRVAVRFSTDDWYNLEQAMFKEILKQQKRNSNELISMPKWEKNPMVAENVQNIYRYLKARADGVLDSDKPGVLK